MSAPTLVAFDTNEATVASNANVTIPNTLSWQTGDVIIVFGGNEGNNVQTLNTPTTTGAGISFGAAKQLHQNSSDCGAGCWAAVATANGSGTFSINDTHSGSRHVLIGVYILRGSGGIGNSALSTGTSRTVSLTPTGADGAIAWIVMDWNADSAQAAIPTATTHSTSSPGPKASPVGTNIALSYTYNLAELDDQTSAGAVSYGIGGSGVGPFTIIAIEAKAGGGGSTNVSLTGGVVGSVTGAPAGTVTASSGGTSVNLTGEVVGSATSAPVGTLDVVINIDEAGAPAGSTTSAPAGSLAIVSNIALTGGIVGSVTGAPAGTVSTSSGSTNVTLTGVVVGSTTGAPAGSLSVTSNVTLAGQVVGSTTTAPVGSINTGSNVSFTGEMVGSSTSAPTGSLAITSNIALTGQTVGSTTAAPAGGITTGSNVSLSGEVVGSSTSALPGSLAIVSNLSLTGVVTGSRTDAPSGTVVVFSLGDGVPVPNPTLTIDAPDTTLTLFVSPSPLELS